MKLFTLQEAQDNLANLLDQLGAGETVRVVRRNGLYVDISGTPDRKISERQTPLPFEVPDFGARLQAVYGDRVMPGNAVLEERESYER